MGVPKFFRWISERYPLCSQLIAAGRIPEFDHLYLDMNGIIHNCSHPVEGSGSVSHRLTPAQMFSAIFAYIEALFDIIKPKKLFFMAIDGTAPRAKMNQQRARRFRTAQEAQELLEKARAAGEEIPAEPPFDSNCITPGTDFMVLLHEQLKYLIHRKQSTDPNWAGIEVILSGHDVPGEGEHKIIEFIRKSRSSSDWSHNLRHCMYGLDADLMMLGLSTHEPHFSLLREEVSFGSKSSSSKSDPTRFYLMHLSLFRDYIRCEFKSLEGPSAKLVNTTPFSFDLERIIDDFILLTFFVGNDFLPSLPGISIHEGSLHVLFEVYRQSIASLGGYLHHHGVLDLTRFQKFVSILAANDLEACAQELGDMAWLKGRRAAGGRKRQGGRKIDTFPADEREDVTSVVQVPDALENGPLNLDSTAFKEWKASYYREKLGTSNSSETAHNMVFSYVQGIQWVLRYYFQGVPSWAWFYPYHYAPKVSDLMEVSDMQFPPFELGKSFFPFEQLMAVLPAASKSHIPAAFRDLMDEGSPIADFYPLHFDLDQNGKKASWEAIVKIPFIDEHRLLKAMASKMHLLTKSERARNSVGPMLRFVRAANDVGLAIQKNYPSSLPDAFPDLHSLVDMKPFWYTNAQPHHFGLLSGANFGHDSPVGFPSLFSLPTSAQLTLHGVSVFDQASKNPSIIVTLHVDLGTPEEEAFRILNQVVYIQWPYLVEARAFSVMDEYFVYSLILPTEDGDLPTPNQLQKRPITADELKAFDSTRVNAMRFYSQKHGTIIGNVSLLAQVEILKGMRYEEDGSYVKDFHADKVLVPVQTVLCRTIEDSRTTPRPPRPVSVDFPVGKVTFFIRDPYYGSPAKVLEGNDAKNNLTIALSPTPTNKPYLAYRDRKFIPKSSASNFYLASFAVAKQLRVSSLTLSKLTSSMSIFHAGSSINIGLNLKFERACKKVVGYTRKMDNVWQFSSKAIKLLQEYKNKFPEIFELIDRTPSGDRYGSEDVFARLDGPAAISARMEELQAWLTSHGVGLLPLVGLEDAMFSDEELSELEGSLISVAKAEAEDADGVTATKPLIVQNVPRAALLLPEHATSRLANQVFTLGDRVAVVQHGVAAPFGSNGTVAGIMGDLIYVVFDASFIGGINFNSRLKEERGGIFAKGSLLNRTTPHLINARPPSVSVTVFQQPKYKLSQSADHDASGFRRDQRGRNQRTADQNPVPRPRAGQQKASPVSSSVQSHPSFTVYPPPPAVNAWKAAAMRPSPVPVHQHQQMTPTAVMASSLAPPPYISVAEASASEITSTLKQLLHIGGGAAPGAPQMGRPPQVPHPPAQVSRPVPPPHPVAPVIAPAPLSMNEVTSTSTALRDPREISKLLMQTLTANMPRPPQVVSYHQRRTSKSSVSLGISSSNLVNAESANGRPASLSEESPTANGPAEDPRRGGRGGGRGRDRKKKAVDGVAKP